MSSTRHIRYLAAARECLLDVGWRRTTLTDVARRAGVSRMTIYRTWPDMPALLADLMTQEWTELASAADAAPADPVRPSSATAHQQIATGVVSLARALRENELFHRILDVDPDLLLPYLLDRRGRTQDGALGWLVERIEAGQAAGEVRPGDPAVLARTVLLGAHGLTLSLATMTDDGVVAADLEATHADLLSAGLAP